MEWSRDSRWNAYKQDETTTDNGVGSKDSDSTGKNINDYIECELLLCNLSFITIQ